METKAKILLIDDDPDYLFATRAILETGPYQIEEAFGGEEGLAKVDEVKPDLIILDVMMPDIDGYRVCKMLKENSRWKSIPVLLLTAVVQNLKTTSYTHEMGMLTDADDFLDKPVDPTVLLKFVENILARPK